MTYEKMSRALRYYYDRQIMFHDEGQKLMYRFGDGAREDRGQSEPDESQKLYLKRPRKKIIFQLVKPENQEDPDS